MSKKHLECKARLEKCRVSVPTKSK